MTLVVRSAIQPEALIPSIRDIIRQLDPKLPIYDAQSLETVRALSVARPRFTTTLLTLFAVVGIMLGATGIYGVLSYSVARRTQEIGFAAPSARPPARCFARSSREACNR